jgi:glycosyltransferase AglE
MSAQPGVSVIVPVYNGEKTVEALIRSLLLLDYPRDRLEIILVDNGSTDSTVSIARRHPVTVLVEDSVRSSYAARNLGLRHARHDLVAFTDADCVVDAQWLTAGVHSIESEHADLAAGKVRFTYSDPPTAGEVYDSLMHMRNDVLVAERKRAVTANLFVRRELFHALGEFPRIRSGGDGIWTSKAVRQGFRLVYAPAAVVFHPARSLREVLEKAYRVGSGYRAEHRDQATWRSIGLIAGSIVPPSPRSAQRLIESRAEPGLTSYTPRVFGVWYLYGLVWGCGALVSMFRKLPPPPAEQAESNRSPSD